MSDIKQRKKIEKSLNNSAQHILGRNIKLYRQRLNMKQADLAQKIGKTVEMLSQIENGVSGTRLSTLDDIASVFGIDAFRLLLPYDSYPLFETHSQNLTELIFELEDKSDDFINALHTILIKS